MRFKFIVEATLLDECQAVTLAASPIYNKYSRSKKTLILYDLIWWHLSSYFGCCCVV